MSKVRKELYMKFKYMRIQGRETSWITKYPKGIFGMCWRKIMDGIVDAEDEKVLLTCDVECVENR